jgi:transcriptional regulator with XRE-family HTH domain
VPFSPAILKTRRLHAGFTVAELAAAARLSDVAVRAYEYGQRIPSVDRAARLAATLGCTVDDLLIRDDNSAVY